jgi:hypothetical protein
MMRLNDNAPTQEKLYKMLLMRTLAGRVNQKGATAMIHCTGSAEKADHGDTGPSGEDPFMTNNCGWDTLLQEHG